jgi:hypothetical protein
MKTRLRCVALCLLSAGALRTAAQHTEGTASDGRDWLRAFVDSCAPYRAELVAADVRNGKLFTNREILRDIDEKERFVHGAEYEAVIGSASLQLQDEFPILRDAFATKRVEACANVTTDMVYLRGRAAAVDFAAIVPIGSLTSSSPRGDWTVTFVRRGGSRDDDLRGFQAQSQEEKPRLLERYLSEFGDISVQQVRAVQSQTQPAGLRIEGVAAFTKLRFSGQLTLVVSGPVLCIELSEVHGSPRSVAKPWTIECRGKDDREPDWTGEANLRAIPAPAPKPPDAQ